MHRSVVGVGIGLRIELANDLFAADDGLVDFVEVHPENHRDRGGAQATMLSRARERFPVITHGLTMGFATVDPIPSDELRSLKRFLDAIEAPFHSDHFCFARASGRIPHELLPPRFDERTIAVAVESIERMRDAIGRDVAIENVSYYVPRAVDPLAEIDALAELLERADAKLLLDVNNIVVNAHNHGFDPRAYLARVPYDRVVQLHVAGHLVRNDGLRIDTHGSTSDAEVRELLGEVLRKTGPIPLLLERDSDIPSFDVLARELRELRTIYDDATAEAEPGGARDTMVARFTPSVRLDSDPNTNEPETPRELEEAVVAHVLAKPAVSSSAPFNGTPSVQTGLGSGLVAERWSLYRSMVRGRLHDLAQGAFPRCSKTIGEARFDAVFDRYLSDRGPETPIFWRVVLELGELLVDSLDGYERDVARLDLAVFRARQAPYPDTRLSNGPIEPFDFDRPVVLTHAFDAFDADHPVDDANEALARIPAKRRIVVVRKADDSTTILGLNPAAAAFLDRVSIPGTSAKHAALALVAERAIAVDAGFLEGLAAMLAQWIELGFVLGVRDGAE